MNKNNQWILKNEIFDPQTALHTAPVYTIGNGLFCCRGFMEEEQEGIAGLGGIYMTGVLGRADYTPWRELGRELVNIPNFFWTNITINDKPISLCPSQMKDFSMELDLETGLFSRAYTYIEDNLPLARFSFSRFASMADIYTAGQCMQITPLQDNLVIAIGLDTNTNITNLNMVSSEPYPIQPGKKQYTKDSHTSDLVSVTIPEPDQIRMAFVQKVCASFALEEKSNEGCRYVIRNKVGITATIQKLISISVSVEDGSSVEDVAKKRSMALTTYQDALADHLAAMRAFWNDSDIIIKGCAEDQLTIRYNILQLAQSCPSHTSRYSIGARGLTGEMYEGSVFWDTEIFMLPFFSLVHPCAARNLLEFRYNTLSEAKIHAKNNWFKGAMYGWQVNPNGVEQTPQGVGAYYSIHVIADIAYAILDYWNCTEDDEFMRSAGLEILIETARFWESRVTLRPDGFYDIMAVRGPNEYDVLVNNNLYTNMMARENFVLCRNLLTSFSTEHNAEIVALRKALSLSDAEVAQWQLIEEKIFLPYDAEQDLWLEDDTYLRRMPLNMSEAKPTAKRIIDTTIPYEALPFYQISKQADVLHLMKNLPWYFTPAQISVAYDFYKPKTAFDSSLSYSMFALMAARLGRMEEAQFYYEKSSSLDIKNVQLNTISGLHFANFGGTWQALIFGFCGVTIMADNITIDPHLPDKWGEITFKLYFKKSHITFSMDNKNIRVSMLSGKHQVISIVSGNETHCLSMSQPLHLTYS